MEKSRYTFSKSERLTHKTLIGDLFTEGHSFVVYPFRIVWKTTQLEGQHPAQVAITVSKRCFKRAVQRNLLKRRIREIYRHNKHILYKSLVSQDIQIAFMIVYLPKTVLKSAEMEPKLKGALKRITDEYEKHTKSGKKGDSGFDDTTH